jgi:hypothetical protein
MANRTVGQIAEEAIARLKAHATDAAFLIIQNDHELMADYLHAVEKDGWQSVNMAIGRAVKIAFPELEKGERNRNPQTVLAQSFSEFE